MPSINPERYVTIVLSDGTTVGPTNPLPTGGSGGGGNAVTIADGADTAQGTTTDAGIITDINGTTIGFLRGAIKMWLTFLGRLPAALVGGRLDVNLGSVGGTVPVSAASLPLPSGASTEATLALIKAKTDNLDVALSTRTKPADNQSVIGNIGGFSTGPSLVLTRAANQTPYSAQDEVGTAGTASTPVSVGRTNGASGFIVGARLIYAANPTVTPAFRLLLFSSAVTLVGDNSPLNLSAADAANFIGMIDLAATQAAGSATSNSQMMGGAPVAPIEFTCGVSTTNIHAVLITTNAFTPIANSEVITILLSVDQN